MELSFLVAFILTGKGYEVIPPVRRESVEEESISDEADVINIKRR